MSRREYLKSSAAAVLGGTIGAVRQAGEQNREVPRGDRILLRGGCVLTLDPALGDFETADVLIEGSKVAAVEPAMTETEAVIVEAENMIVMPGFVDTHRHMWEGVLRNILPDGLLSDYTRDITGAARDVYRPEDAYIGDLVSALGAVNAGVTTLLDWSHIGNSPDHSDGAIEGLREAGIRGVYAFGSGSIGPQNRFPDDIHRLRATHFSSSDQMLTLAMAAGLDRSAWSVARDAGAPITVHVNGQGQLLGMADAMGPDVTYIHCPNLTDTEWQMVADTGGGISISCPIEMQMGHGIPGIQKALDHGIRPSLSTDVETEMSGDFFTQMRAVFALQRMLRLAQSPDAATAPDLLTVREVLEFATIGGARVNGLDGRIGTLTPGKEADIVLLRMDRINVLPVNNAYGAAVLSMDTSNVDTVIIGGAFKKWRGELVGVDLDRVSRLAHASRDYILSEAGWPETLLGGYLPGH